MSNRLIDKIHSYTTKLGIDFNEAFTGSYPSRWVGSLNSACESITNTNGGLTSTVNDGPFPGQYSWNFRNESATNKAARIRNYCYGIEPTVFANNVRPQNFTVSLWVRVNHDITLNPGWLRPITDLQTVGTPTTGPGTGDDWYQGWWFAYFRDNNSGSPTYLKHGFNLYTGGLDYYMFTDENGQAFQKNKWYLLTIRKTKTSSTNVQVEFLVNGHVKFTGNHQYYDYAVGQFDFGSATTQYDTNFSVASFFLGENSVFTNSVLQEIAFYGSPIHVPVKYWDGSNWQTSSNQQIWNGSKWIPMYASKWDGSAWIPV